ncbi:MAG: carboxypeptidase regulatory-like domain-containing protein [candidate division WOR-3 bacterium]
MRRYLIISIVLAVVPVFAYTTISGGKGLFLVKDARTEEAGLNVALHLLGRNLTIPGTTDKGYIGDLIAPTLNWTPLSTQYVGAEIFANWGGIFQYAQVGDRVYDIGLHDLKAGAKISIPYLPVLKLGGMASYTFFFRDDGNRWIEQTAVPVDTFSWAGLATLRLQDLFSSLPNLMVNYGKAGVWTNYGLGLELAGEGMALFAELTSRQGVNSTGIFDTENGFVRLTPGVTFGSPRGFALTLGYGVSLTENSPNQVILGMNIATPFFRKPAVVFGELSGKVVDASSKQPVLATVEFPDNPKLKPLVTDAAGLFLVKKLPTGVLKVRVTAEGYRPLETFVNVETKAAGPVQFELYPLVIYGTLAGTVTDSRTGRPLSAQIGFAEPGVEAVQTDPNTGAYRKDNMPVGTYTVTASADGYFPSTATIQIEENRITTQNFTLSPLAVKTVVTGTVTDRGTNAALKAKVVFKDAVSGSLFTEVETEPTTGVYVAEVPVGTYALTATADGYIEQSAALVVQEGKPATHNFALVKVGTAVTLKGIYFDFGKATIRFPESQEALQAAYNILKENPTIKVEIQGHTDNVGSDEFNQKLSEQRAWAVVNYLVQQMGVESSRLIAKGYGETQPKASNDTPEGRALNRRVEFVVIGEIGK